MTLKVKYGDFQQIAVAPTRATDRQRELAAVALTLLAPLMPPPKASGCWA